MVRYFLNFIDRAEPTRKRILVEKRKVKCHHNKDHRSSQCNHNEPGVRLCTEQNDRQRKKYSDYEEKRAVPGFAPVAFGLKNFPVHFDLQSRVRKP